MAPAETSSRGRVVILGFFRSIRECRGSQEVARKKGSTYGQGYAIEEIAPGDRAIHSQRSIPALSAHRPAVYHSGAAAFAG